LIRPAEKYLYKIEMESINIQDKTILIPKDIATDYKASCIHIIKSYFKKYTIDDVETLRGMIITNYEDGIVYYLRTWNITETPKKIKVLYSLTKFYNSNENKNNIVKEFYDTEHGRSTYFGTSIAVNDIQKGMILLKQKDYSDHTEIEFYLVIAINKNYVLTYRCKGDGRKVTDHKTGLKKDNLYLYLPDYDPEEED
jgi:hypothetical protein